MQKFRFARLAKGIAVVSFFVKKVWVTTDAIILHIGTNMGLLLVKSKFRRDCYN